MSKKNKTIAILVLIVLLLAIITTGPYMKPLFSKQSPIEVKTSVLVVVTTSMLLSYVVSFIALPRFFKSKKVIPFILVVIAALGLLFLTHLLIRPNTDHLSLEHFNLPPGVFSFAKAPPFPFPLVFIIFVLPATFSMYLLWTESVHQREVAENEQLKSELNFLKSQISPHFLFNSLNTIYALSQSDPEKSGQVTLKLSKLLRFLVYDTQKEKTIPIAEEIEFLDNYISLSALRLTSKTQVQFNHKIEDPNFQIPPLLLLIFVENCFKHGVTTQKESTICIDISQSDNQLIFETSNLVIENNKKQDQNGHVGLVNVKRRLELNYPEGGYTLNYKTEEDQFKVRLKLDRI